MKDDVLGWMEHPDGLVWTRKVALWTPADWARYPVSLNLRHGPSDEAALLATRESSWV